MEDNRDLLLVASEYGKSVAGSLGQEVMKEFELCYAASLLPRFNNNPMRTKQHLLLLWDQSFFKSTLISQFRDTIPECFETIDVTSMSPQMLFGSINETKDYVIEPAFANKKFATITELLSFLGTGVIMRDIVNTMNKIMENEWVTRKLLKLGQRDFDPIQTRKLEQRGVFYDPRKAELRYKPETTIIAASRPMPNKTYTHLKFSGHLYRFHILQYELSDSEVKKFFRENYSFDIGAKQQLAELNRKLATIIVKRAEMPPEQMMSTVLDLLEQVVADELGANSRLGKFIDMRVKGDCIREMASHSLLRTVKEQGFIDIEQLSCTDDDIEYICDNISHFIEARVHPLFVEDFSVKVHKKRPKEYAKDFIVNLLSDGKLRKGKGDIVETTAAEIGCGNATAYNALRELRDKEGTICSPKYGYYKLKNCKTCELREFCKVTNQ